MNRECRCRRLVVFQQSIMPCSLSGTAVKEGKINIREMRKAIEKKIIEKLMEASGKASCGCCVQLALLKRNIGNKLGFFLANE